MGDFEQLVLLQLILENTGIYLHELQERVYSRFGVTPQYAGHYDTWGAAEDLFVTLHYNDQMN